MTAKINMRGVQESVEDNAKKVREVGRKALLAYLGVWGLSYDLGKSVYKDGWTWVEKAEKRGEGVEKELMSLLDAYQKDFPGEVKKLAHTVEVEVKTVTKDVTFQAEKVAKNLEKYFEQYVRRSGAAEVVEEIKVNGEAAVKKVKAVVKESVEEAQEMIESAADSVWKGYDSLSVKDIMAGLENKSVKDLEFVRAYEAGNKNRVTVLREIDARLQAKLS